MKKAIHIFFIAASLLLTAKKSIAQNVGVGTPNPLNKFQVAGNFVVTQPTSTSTGAPTAAQTKTMINGSTISFSTADLVGRVYDPGGAAGNYLPNLTANASFGGPIGGHIGIQAVIEDIGLGIGDSLIFQNGNNHTIYYLAIGSSNNSAGAYIFNTESVNILFKSNADASIGTGFSLLLRYVYAEPGNNVKPWFAGKTLFFDIEKGALRVGDIGNGAVGDYSIAMGRGATASGNYSFATGSITEAIGPVSTAMGYSTTASGAYSTALGNRTNASGENATAIGYLTNASGENATAMGYQTTASGNYSTAMGKSVRTNGHTGSFIIGDAGDRGIYYSDVPNQMQMVFAGGYRLYTGTASSGVYMNGGDNSWSAVSDKNKKEKLLPVDGELFLDKISRLSLSSWNYKGQSAKQYRHYGPMAQDFHNAFGKDAYGNIGCDTLINQQDFLGINLIAIQALEKRTAKIEALQKQNTALQQQLEQVQQNNLALQQQMKALLDTVGLLDKQMKLLAAKEKEKNTLAANK